MPTIQITNQKPVNVYDPSAPLLMQSDYTIPEAEFLEKQKEHIENQIVKPLFVPVQTNQAVTIRIDQNNVNDVQITEALRILLYDTQVDPDLIEQTNALYQKSMHYAPQTNAYYDRIMQHEAMVRNRLPLPVNKNGRTVRYTATHDVIPSAKGLYQQTPTDPKDIDVWTASMSGFLHEYALNEALIVTVRSSDVFDELQSRVVEIGNQESRHMQKSMQALYRTFGKTALRGEMSLSITLPHKGLTTKSNGTEPYHLNRTLYHVLAEFERSHVGECIVTPTTLQGLYAPSQIIFINAEQVMQSSPKDIAKNFDDVKKAFNIAKKLPLITNKQLATTKNVNALTSTKANVDDGKRRHKFGRNKIIPVKAKPVGRTEIIKMIAKVAKERVSQSQTENSFKTQAKTYMRANRRKPLDTNVAGVTKRTEYRPDIHIYLDTSGSITESMYKDSINALIQLALMLDVNLYFTSFATDISETSLLQTKGRSASEIYKAFQLVPKVAGGTNFKAVWQKIDLIDERNKRNAQSYQLNFVITDFGYSIQKDMDFTTASAHRDNTYYVPISTDEGTWQHIRKWSTKMIKSMTALGHIHARRYFLM